IICALGGSWQAQAQIVEKSKYPAMVPPIEQYLIPDRNAEIALARTAAPESLSRDATVLVLTKHGYETAVEGKNGCVSVVERGWGGPIDNSQFWNPKNRSPHCLNPQAVHLVLPVLIKRTELVMAGKTHAEIKDWEKNAYAKKELPTTVEPGAISYMISKHAYLSDGGDHNPAHLMIYLPLDTANWGADADDPPLILFIKGPPEPFTVYLIPVGRWSDGTKAPIPGQE